MPRELIDEQEKILDMKWEELLFREEIKAWEESGVFDCRITVDKVSGGADSYDGHVGLITTLIPPLDINISSTIAVIVGPPIMYRFTIAEALKKGIAEDRMQRIVDRLAAGDHTTVPGLVRVSLGIYNTREDIDYLTEAFRSIVTDGPRARYVLHPTHRDYVPEDWDFDFDSYLPF